MIHGLIDSVSIGNKEKISVSPSLKETAAFMGFKIYVVRGCSDLSYMPIYFSSLNELCPIDPVEELVEEFENLAGKKISDRTCNSVIIELLAAESSELISFISLQNSRTSINIRALATLEKYKGRGAGQFLMCCAIDIATKQNVKTLKLKPEGSAKRFYMQKIGMIENKNSELEYIHPEFLDTEKNSSPVLSKFKLLQTEETSHI
ncbi:GNAT family N-acetyltransferase [Parendozoicomonas sp. Alg238-R29]|uniref:GNAT family N-acetyltransferase n=1 Tax=Parendozoicomonas sp. Alg238-R29 TaxID=2993446 RepID=UPI00248E83D4|nr:GNAT family N-acetyltransferase [Parendozoicomonas sp. Alg238-R29]